MGRGGAAFPTGVKWEAVARQPARPHYLICNADESEPGTFKDRVADRGRPVRAGRGDDDRRATRPAASTATSTCAASTRWRTASSAHAHRRGAARGFLGDDVLGEGFAFDIEIRKGAGAYICGEETAIFNSIEGFRGEPRNKPPFPVEVGLFGKPTVDQQRRDARQRARRAGSRRAGVRGHRHRGVDRHEAVLPLRQRQRARASTRCRSAPRCGELIELAGGVPDGPVAAGGAAGRRGRRLRRARRARPAADVRGRARGQDDARLRRRDGVRRHGRPAAACCCGSRRSSATSRAASACRAASAPSARRRRWRGIVERPRGRGDELALIARDRPVHARRVDLRPRPDRVERDRVGDRPTGGCCDDADRRAAAHGRVRDRRRSP